MPSRSELEEAPLVSIVIIAYNEEKYLSLAIESAINQSYTKKEIILVDDGSSDNTLAVAQRYSDKIIVISQKNSGGCSSPRNRGLRAAKGKYIAFLDGDDLLLSNKLENQVASLERNPQAVCIINNYKNFKEQEIFADHFSTCTKLMKKFEEHSSQEITFNNGSAADLLIEENFSIASSPLFKREAVERVNGFSEVLFACEDFHLVYRIAIQGDVLVGLEPLFLRRIHGNNMSANKLKMSKYYVLSRFDLFMLERDNKRREMLKARVKSYLIPYFKQSIKLGLFREIWISLKVALKLLLTK